jgi:Tfp pilus assembly protein PilF
MATSRYTVIYETNAGVRHKLCRVLLMADGSYGITVPYHPSEQVTLIRQVINYPNRDARAEEDPIEMAVVGDDEHRLKLSHHPDGFVQFSGTGIRSGRNPDGSAKGLGMRSFPLGQPTAGPAYGVTIFGPEAFTEAGAARKGDLVFREADLHRSERSGGLIIEVYCLPGRWRRFVRMRDGVPVVWINHPSGATLELIACMGPGKGWEHGFVGVDLWSLPLASEVSSGFMLASPTANLHYNGDEELEGEALYAIYPPTIPLVGGTPIDLAFPPRNDPAYHRGGAPPSGRTVMPQGAPPRGPEEDLAGNAEEEPDDPSPAPPGSAAEIHNQGNRLRDEGDPGGAREEYEAAIEADDHEVSPRSAYNLGHLLEESDPEAAEAAYRRAIDYDDPHFSPRAGVNLGRLLFSQGKIKASKAALIRAANYEDFEQRPKALINLATAQRAEGIKGAAEALATAAASGHPELGPTAGELLGDLYAEAGQRDSASAAFVGTAQMDHPLHSSRAAIKLGRMAEDEGDLEGAEDAYRIAMEGKHPQLSTEAAYYVGHLRIEAGDVDGAREPLELAATSESGDVMKAAQLGLARLELEEETNQDSSKEETRSPE